MKAKQKFSTWENFSNSSVFRKIPQMSASFSYEEISSKFPVENFCNSNILLLIFDE